MTVSCDFSGYSHTLLYFGDNVGKGKPPAVNSLPSSSERGYGELEDGVTMGLELSREPLELGSEAANRRPTQLGLGLSSSNEKPRINIALNMTGNGKVNIYSMSCCHCYVYSILHRV